MMKNQLSEKDISLVHMSPLHILISPAFAMESQQRFSIWPPRVLVSLFFKRQAILVSSLAEAIEPQGQLLT